MSLLEINGLTKVFPDGTVALEDINLTIEHGEFVIIAGTNGSGKTVLTRHLNGLLSPTKGQIILEGEPISKDLLRARMTIGLIFQNSDHQIVGQTVKEDVAFGPENLGISRAEIEDRVKESLEAVGLEKYADHFSHTLSGGQKKRLAIAGVLAMRPKIIVLDEPFAGLDYPGVVQVLREIVALHRKGHTIVLVTHELDKVLAHATRLVVIENGRIVRDDRPENIIEDIEAFGIKKPIGVGRKVETMTWLK
jgi:biotin transport system ATP-binding protein